MSISIAGIARYRLYAIARILLSANSPENSPENSPVSEDLSSPPAKMLIRYRRRYVFSYAYMLYRERATYTSVKYIARQSRLIASTWLTSNLQAQESEGK